MKKNIFILSLTFLAFCFNSCNNSSRNQSNYQTTIENISGMTLNSRYIYLEFQSNGHLNVYQKTSKAANARGCAAEGSWAQQGNSVSITITQSYCGTNSYSDLNGTFVINGNCMSNTSSKYCK